MEGTGSMLDMLKKNKQPEKVQKTEKWPYYILRGTVLGMSLTGLADVSPSTRSQPRPPHSCFAQCSSPAVSHVQHSSKLPASYPHPYFYYFHHLCDLRGPDDRR